MCRGVEGGKVQSVPGLLDRTGQVLRPAGARHLDEEPCVQVQGVALVLGAVVLGGHVRAAHQLPAAGVEVPQDAGGGGSVQGEGITAGPGQEGDHGPLLSPSAEGAAEGSAGDLPLRTAVVLPLPLNMSSAVQGGLPAVPAPPPPCPPPAAP